MTDLRCEDVGELRADSEWSPRGREEATETCKCKNGGRDGKDARRRDQRDERQRGGSVCDLSGRREEMLTQRREGKRSTTASDQRDE